MGSIMMLLHNITRKSRYRFQCIIAITTPMR